MAEYIERENIFNFLTEQLDKETGAFSKGFNKGINVARSAIHSKEITPTADVVEVVRCKDCKWCEDMAMSGMYCNHPDGRNTIHCRPDDYCNDGERKDDVE